MIHAPLIWTPWDRDPAVLQRLSDILESWERTPYVTQPGPDPKGEGINCIGFLCGVLDEWTRAQTPADFPRLPSDLSMNNPTGARRAMRMVLETFPKHERLHNTIRVQPGDIVVVGQGGPGHAMIIGPRRNTIWHASGTHVHYTGWELPTHCKHFATYRLTGRDNFI